LEYDICWRKQRIEKGFVYVDEVFGALKAAVLPPHYKTAKQPCKALFQQILLAVYGTQGMKAKKNRGAY
jgi:hypothetical protein